VAKANKNYVFWTKYGERGVVMEDNKEKDDDNNIPN
jgi:membrane-bound inhibitor of C-type lysozyme